MRSDDTTCEKILNLCNYRKETETTMRTSVCFQPTNTGFTLLPGTTEKLDKYEPMARTILNRRPRQSATIRDSKPVRWALRPPGHCMECSQAVLRGQETRAEQGGLPELGKHSSRHQAPGGREAAWREPQLSAACRPRAYIQQELIDTCEETTPGQGKKHLKGPAGIVPSAHTGLGTIPVPNS